MDLTPLRTSRDFRLLFVAGTLLLPGAAGGQVRPGFVADTWSVRGAIMSGGVACVAGVALTALWLPDFWAHDIRTDEHARAERARRAAAA